MTCLFHRSGNLFDSDVEYIVNPWNRNFIPWWLLLPQGVSGELRRRGGTAPFRELAKAGVLREGQAFLTGPGRLPFKGIIHVAGLNLFWIATEFSVRASTRSALQLATRVNARSLALPLIGAGTGGLKPDRVQSWISEEAERSDFPGRIVVVRFEK